MGSCAAISASCCRPHQRHSCAALPVFALMLTGAAAHHGPTRNTGSRECLPIDVTSARLRPRHGLPRSAPTAPSSRSFQCVFEALSHSRGANTGNPNVQVRPSFAIATNGAHIIRFLPSVLNVKVVTVGVFINLLRSPKKLRHLVRVALMNG